jgi:tRNA-splicing ligase RtcB
MIAHRTQFTVDDLRSATTSLAELRIAIEVTIPSSMGRYNQQITATARPRIDDLYSTPGADQASDIAPTWPDQLGSLGSGNHFIEVTADEEERIWLFLHSGSRGVGNKLAMKHIKVAQEQCKAHNEKLESPDLAFLEEGTPQFDAYIEALRWAQLFALLNREEMMDRLTRQFSWWIGEPVSADEKINCHHNYTMKEEHYGKTVWLSRKGAIDASLGRLGLIPGSMGAASYVVSGLGNPESFNSSPHGAGRVHSRGSAKRTFTLEDLEIRMKGIEWRHDKGFLDEHPLAYKSIDTVMADSVDLVTIVHELHQLVNVKGM